MKILDYKDKVTALEGCASLKSLQAKVPRYRKVQLTGNTSCVYSTPRSLVPLT